MWSGKRKGQAALLQGERARGATRRLVSQLLLAMGTEHSAVAEAFDGVFPRARAGACFEHRLDQAEVPLMKTYINPR